MLSYGIKRGLAYKHNFLEWEQQRNQQEMLDKQDEHMRMQKANWLSEQMTMGKTFTEFDQKGLTNDAHTRILPEISKLMNQPGAYANAEVLAKVRMLGEELKNNKWVQQSNRWNQQMEMLRKDLSDPELANDPDARAALMEQMEQANNYNKTGNKLGLDTGEVDEFFYQRPKIFDVNEFFDNVKVGTRESIYKADGLLYQDQHFADLDGTVQNLFAGKNGRDLDNAWAKAQATSPYNDKYAWAKNLIKTKHTLARSATQLHQASGDGSGNGGFTGAYNYYRNNLVPKVSNAVALSLKTKTRASENLTGKGNYNLAQGVNVGDDGNLTYTVPPNAGLIVPKADGTLTKLSFGSGLTLKATDRNTITAVNGVPYYEVLVDIPAKQGEHPELDKNFLDGVGWIDDNLSMSKNYPGSSVETEDGSNDDIKGFRLITYVPVDLERGNLEQTVNQIFTGTKNATDAAQDVNYARSLANEIRSIKPGESALILGKMVRRDKKTGKLFDDQGVELEE